MSKLWFPITIAILLATAGSAFAQAKLKAGDPAPAVKVGQWIKGQPIKKIEPGKIYVIEFWATWCGPCRQSIPHLTELAKKYKGKATFAGISVWENGPAKGVVDFVKSMGAKMDYNVATDSSDQFMAKSWMEAAGERGIPTAFIIGKSRKILWIGHPMAMDGVLAQVISGKFNASAFMEEREKQKVTEEKQSKLFADIRTLTEQGKPKEALTKLDQYVAEDPAAEMDLIPTRLHLLYLDDEPAGYVYVRKLADRFGDNPSVLLFLAGSIIDENSKPKSPDYDLALSLANRAEGLCGDREPRVLDTLSRVYEAKGDIGKAVEYAEKTLSAVENDKSNEAPPQVLDMLKTRVATLKGKQK